MKSMYFKAIVVCAVLGFFSGNPLHAQVQFNLVDGEPIRSQADVDALKTGDTLIMTCAHCKAGSMITYSSDPASPGHVKWMQAGNEKPCAHCGGTMKTVKVGDKTKLVCSKCGDMGFVTAYKTGQ
jgi:hypothetical protein